MEHRICAVLRCFFVPDLGVVMDWVKLWMLRGIRGVVVGTLMLLCSEGILRCARKIERDVDGR